LALSFPFRRVEAPTETTPSVQRRDGGAIPNDTDDVMTLYVVKLEFAGPAAGTPAS
jgi:hypothetical protein